MAIELVSSNYNSHVVLIAIEEGYFGKRYRCIFACPVVITTNYPTATYASDKNGRVACIDLLPTITS